MSTAISEPPIGVNVGLFDDSLDDGNSVRFYIAYQYLPLKSISVLMKTFDELYELVYFILYEERVSDLERLTLDYGATGNSFEWIAKLVEAIKPSKKALIAVTITAAIVSTPIEIQKYRKFTAERHQIEAQTEKTKAETRKINAETEGVELENILKRNRISQDSIAKINTEENRKRILRKQRTIKKVVTDKPIIRFEVNNTIIYNRANEEL